MYPLPLFILSVLYFIVLHCVNTQYRAAGEVSVLGGDITDNFRLKIVHMDTCLILNGYTDRIV